MVQRWTTYLDLTNNHFNEIIKVLSITNITSIKDRADESPFEINISNSVIHS